MGFEVVAVILPEERQNRWISRSTDGRAQQSDELHDEGFGSNRRIWQLEWEGEGVDWRDRTIGERQSRYRRLRIFNNSR